MNTSLKSAPIVADPEAGAMRVEPRLRCTLCGGPGQVLHAAVPDHLCGVPGSWSLRQCLDRNCGLVWQDPMVVREDLWLAYTRYHTHSPAADGAANGKDLLPTPFLLLDRWIARLLRLDSERQSFTRAYLDELPPGRLLDVGCGNGRFAATMQRRGWTVRGSDFDPKAAENAMKTHGIQVDVGDLRDLAYESESFEVVTLRHVIEHVREPLELLEECRRILKPGGRLVMVTPNADSLGHRHFGPRWRGLEQPRHLFLYSPSSMRALLQRGSIGPMQIFSSAQGAAFLLRKSSEGGGGLRAARDQLAIWWLTIREAMHVRRGRQVGEELVAWATKAAADRASA